MPVVNLDAFSITLTDTEAAVLAALVRDRGVTKEQVAARLLQRVISESLQPVTRLSSILAPAEPGAP